MVIKLLISIGLVLATNGATAQELKAPPAPAPVTGPVLQAQAPPLVTPGVATLGELDRVQSQIVLMNAKAKLAESRKALATAQGRGEEEETTVESAPVVAGVFGSTARPYAKFLLAGGGQTIGRRGDLISDGYRVEHVGVDQVVIKDKKGRRIIARFSGTAPVRASSADEMKAQSPAPGMPSVPGG